jgi:signal transduction histidine kinase
LGRTILEAGRDLIGLSETAREIQTAMENADTSRSTIEATAVVEDVIADHRETYPDVAISVSLPDAAPVSAIGALESAIDNVVENACKHNDSDDPRVEVAIGERTIGGTDRVVVKVADNGPGIPEQEKNVLVKGRETALEHGSGLGLWLVYWVVDKSEGNLRFDENEPRGSVVTLELHAEVPEDVTPTAPT